MLVSFKPAVVQRFKGSSSTAGERRSQLNIALENICGIAKSIQGSGVACLQLVDALVGAAFA
jgi:hypothetical protein